MTHGVQVPWYRRLRTTLYSSFAEVKADFPSADWVKGLIVFDILGNRSRLIVAPNFRVKRFSIKFVGPHRQYDVWTLENLR